MHINYQEVFALMGADGREVVDHWATNFPDEFSSIHGGWTFVAEVAPNGRLTAGAKPVHGAECGRMTRVVLFFVTDDRQIEFKFGFETKWLRTAKHLKYSLYCVRFEIASDNATFDQAARSVLASGYVGVTGRSPFTRFREHRRDAYAGRGHLLHKAWNSLLRMKVEFLPDFYIAHKTATQDDIYTSEELLVEKLSLTPKGLNVIPGGMAGIRMLHQLRLLRGNQTSPDDRDAALGDLESGARKTHFRTGHIRKLPTSKITWVRPCWVNLPKVDLAV